MSSTSNITPLHDRVIVRPAPAEEKTAGGIIIPDTAKEKPQRGIVVAVGAGKKDEPITVKEGDSVLYGKYAGTEIKLDGQDLLMMRESDILAIVYHMDYCFNLFVQPVNSFYHGKTTFF